MKTSAEPAFTRTCEVVLLVTLLVAQMAFVMGGWWVWLAYTSARA